jgi:hypothetical protein
MLHCLFCPVKPFFLITHLSIERKESLSCQTKKMCVSSVVLLKRTRVSSLEFSMPLLSRTALPSAPIANRYAILRRSIKAFIIVLMSTNGSNGSASFLGRMQKISLLGAQSFCVIGCLRILSSFAFSRASACSCQFTILRSSHNETVKRFSHVLRAIQGNMGTQYKTTRTGRLSSRCSSLYFSASSLFCTSKLAIYPFFDYTTEVPIQLDDILKVLTVHMWEHSASREKEGRDEQLRSLTAQTDQENII